MNGKVKRLYVTDRGQWREWLSEHHETEAGVWLVFYKKATALLEKGKKLGMK